jgi:hypothetical protein
MQLRATSFFRHASRAGLGHWITSAAIVLAAPAALAAAQEPSTHETDASPVAVGERYHVELAGTLWNPSPSGTISSAQLGIIGDQIDFTKDLAFQQSRMKDLRVVLRPSKKAKFKIQYTPIIFQADTLVKRAFVFNGQRYQANVPISSEFDWKVLRLGYEYDFLYKSRGFVGMLLEGRLTQMNATLAAPFGTEYNSIRVPLPSIGVVGRGYVAPNVAINFSLSGFQIPRVPNAQANYYDWDVSSTYNINNNFGVQGGWRRVTTFIDYKNDTGNIKFQGIWFGAAVRY